MLDDPLVGLDFKLREKLIDDLRQTRETLGVTFLYATADSTEALSLATKVGVLAEGEVQEYGLPRDVYQTPQRYSTMANLCLPQSNAWPVTLKGSSIETPWGTVPATIDGSVSDDATLSALVRPERIGLGRNGGAAIEGEATVRLREDLGAEEIVYLESEGHQFTSLVRADSADLDALRLGETVRFGVPAEAVVLFADGQRVGHGGT